MRNGIGVMMSCALVLGSLCGVAPARAQDTGAPDGADGSTSTQTTNTRTTNTPDGSRVETRRTTGSRTSTSSAPPPAQPAAQPPAQLAPAADPPRTDLIYIEAIGGYSFVNMKAISYDNLYPEVVDLTGAGFAAGLAAGVRLSILTIGGRATLASYPGFEVGTAAAELTLHLPTGVVEPWVRVGIGYGWLGEANYDFPKRSETSVYGYVFQGAIGVDIYLGKVVSLGGGCDLDVLNMSRQPLTVTPSEMASLTGVDLTKDGNAVGLQLRGHFAVTLHF